MSSHEIGKKEIELEELWPFLTAYEHATTEQLSLVCAGEDPDFICARADTSKIGIELTKVTRDPRDKVAERILLQKHEMEPYETIEKIHLLIEKKEKARQNRYIKNIRDTILVLQLVDASLDSLKYILKTLQNEFNNHGFYEIWLADYSGHEAYGDIELFGLFPPKMWGFYQRPQPSRKPYG